MDPKKYEYPRASRTDTTESILLSVVNRLKGKNLREKKDTRAYVEQAFNSTQRTLISKYHRRNNSEQ